MTVWKNIVVTEEIGGAIVVRFNTTRLRGDENARAIEELFALADTLGKRKMVLSFVGVIQIDKTALGKCITLQKRIAGGGGRLILCGISEQVHEVAFATTHFDKTFTILQDEQAALQA